MNKKVLYLGVLLFIFGLAVLFLSVPQSNQYQGLNISAYHTIELTPNSSISIPIQINGTGLAVAEFKSTEPTLYLFENYSALSIANSIAYNAINSSYAISLRNRGIYSIGSPNYSGVYTYTYNSSASSPTNALASYNPLTYSSFINENGTYYMTFRNVGSNSSTLIYNYFSTKISSLPTNYIGTISITSIAGPALSFIGMVLIILSLMMKSKKAIEEERLEDARIEKAYSRLEKLSRTKSTVRHSRQRAKAAPRRKAKRKSRNASK
jgi:uncharacterized membrane protein